MFFTSLTITNKIFINIFCVASLINLNFLEAYVLLQPSPKEKAVNANNSKRLYHGNKNSLNMVNLEQTNNISAETIAKIEHIRECFKRVEKNYSKLTTELLSLEGMSSSKVRHFLNNLCSMPDTYYLEIGVFKGSTFIAALYQNQQSVKEATAIDNWSEFGNNKDIFLYQTKKHLNQINFRFIEQDSFTLNIEKNFSKKINIYFYDGYHSAEAQKKAFTYYNNIFDDTFITVIDDWNSEDVRKGTFDAFDELHYSILFEAELPAQYNGDLANWWNGIYVAIVSKSII